MIRVADYIADFIYQQGVRDVFMLSGGGSIYLDDGIACHDKLNHICARNEAAAPMMAEAYARVTGKIGVVYVTTGPGGTNAISGVAEAWTDSVPIVMISGQVGTEHIINEGPRSFGVQGFNIVKSVNPLTKYAVVVTEPESIRYHLEKAVYLARSDRPGPVWVDVPLDVQKAMVDESQLAGYDIKEREGRSVAIAENVGALMALLRNAKRPVFVGGNGVRISGGKDEFKKLAERLNVPVVLTRLTGDLLPYSHKNNFGCAGISGRKSANLILKNSDLIVSFGCRLAPPFLGEDFQFFPEAGRLAAVDIDATELDKHRERIDLAIEADAKDVLHTILNEVEADRAGDYAGWIEQCEEWVKDYPTTVPADRRDPINLYYLISRVDKLSRPKTIFVTDAGTSYHIAEQVLCFEDGKREITSGALAAMGLAIPFSVGCSAADREAQVVILTGDGSMELNVQELKTISYYDLNVKVFIMNNGGYVTIKNIQDKLCDGRYIGSERPDKSEMLDLEKVAAAFDLPYKRIDKCDEVDEKIVEIINTDGPVFVDVVCDKNQTLIES